MSNISSGKRSRNWLFVLYPESAPDDWKQYLEGLHIEWVESPCHDMDVDEDGNGTLKKSHYHILLRFDSLKSFKQVREITDHLNQPIPVICNSVKGSIRYMAHLDNPDKHQYDIDKIVCHGNFDMDDIIKLTVTEKRVILSEIRTWIFENGVTEFSTLIEYAHYNNPVWTELLEQSHTIYFNSLLRSQKYKLKEKDSDD